MFRGKRLQDWILLSLALVIFVSPWWAGFVGDKAAEWCAGLTAIVLAYLASASLAEYKQWEEWVALVIGAWLTAAPWALGFVANSAAAQAFWAIGGLVVAVSLWAEWSFRHSAPPSRR
jgi:hypothetical protein